MLAPWVGDWVAAILTSHGSDRHGRRRADGLGRSRYMRSELLEGLGVDLRERREWLNRVAQDVERHVRPDSHRGLLQPLASLRAEGVGACQPFAVAEQCYEAVAVGVSARVGGGLRDVLYRDRGHEATRIRPHSGSLRIRVDHSRDGVVVGPPRLPEDVRGNHIALVLADVCERPDPDDVADRPEALCGTQMRVDRDSPGVRLDANGLQADPADPRAASRGNQHPVAAQLAAVVELQNVVLAFAPRAVHIRGQDELDALARQDLPERLAQRSGLPAEQVLRNVDDHGFAAEPANRLRDLDPDWPAAQDEQPAWNRLHARGLPVGPDAVKLTE